MTHQLLSKLPSCHTTYSAMTLKITVNTGMKICK